MKAEAAAAIVLAAHRQALAEAADAAAATLDAKAKECDASVATATELQTQLVSARAAFTASSELAGTQQDKLSVEITALKASAAAASTGTITLQAEVSALMAAAAADAETIAKLSAERQALIAAAAAADATLQQTASKLEALTQEHAAQLDVGSALAKAENRLEADLDAATVAAAELNVALAAVKAAGAATEETLTGTNAELGPLLHFFHFRFLFTFPLLLGEVGGVCSLLVSLCACKDCFWVGRFLSLLFSC